MIEETYEDEDNYGEFLEYRRIMKGKRKKPTMEILNKKNISQMEMDELFCEDMA
ncbi:MAG: hypothetical protein QXG00_05300 [Candidatus Woesearchaeota archaeon]